MEFQIIRRAERIGPIAARLVAELEKKAREQGRGSGERRESEDCSDGCDPLHHQGSAL
jgi:hypothetical protein